jgi:hypothetical protein
LVKHRSDATGDLKKLMKGVRTLVKTLSMIFRDNLKNFFMRKSLYIIVTSYRVILPDRTYLLIGQMSISEITVNPKGSNLFAIVFLICSNAKGLLLDIQYFAFCRNKLMWYNCCGSGLFFVRIRFLTNPEPNPDIKFVRRLFVTEIIHVFNSYFINQKAKNTTWISTVQ